MKHYLLIILLLIASYPLFAQDGKIRGSVIDDATGEAAPFATVVISGTSIGATTDFEGGFTFSTAPGTYSVEISFVGYQTVTVEGVEVKADEVTLLDNIRLKEDSETLEAVVIEAEVVNDSEAALNTIKKKSATMLDGISSEKFKLTGDGNAAEAAKRVTGLSIEGGKYIYIRGLGDRYSKTTLNGMDIPGLDPDRNTIQMDIFPTNLIDRIVVSKNFTADQPADFTGGLLNIDTKDFPDEKIISVSVGTSYNPDMNLNSDYLTYKGGDNDFLGFDDGTRDLPSGADLQAGNPNFPTNPSVYNSELGADRENNFLNYSFGISIGNQISLNEESAKDPKLGYIFSFSYRNSYTYYDEVTFGDYQIGATEMIAANRITGQQGERSVLIGALGGIAYKTLSSKYKLTAMHLQNGESRAGKFTIFNDLTGQAAGQSGYTAFSDNLEYNQRSVTNLLINGEHYFDASGWDIDWRGSITFSNADDPDIRKTAFTLADDGVTQVFNAGAGGNPSRIWRFLDETSAHVKVDLSKSYYLFNDDAKLKFGVSYLAKQRDYRINEVNLNFTNPGFQEWDNPDPEIVMNPQSLADNDGVFQSINAVPNPNAYEANTTNLGFYISNEFTPFSNMKAIVGLRTELFQQFHTGRDNQNTRVLDNEKVLDSFDFFPSVNLIYSIRENQNMRGSYTRTIARPSFKELSFAQILDPFTNRIFNGSLLPVTNPTTGELEWDGNLTETRIDNFDLRWELFLERGQIFSVSAFYKSFEKPIELVNISGGRPQLELQPRNVGNAQLFGFEFEFNKNLDFISYSLSKLSISGNLTLVQSEVDMTDTEFNFRKSAEKPGENVERTRDMAGQAPYVINAGIGYSDYDIGLNAGIFYNVQGPTLAIVGGNGIVPDVYSEPFHSINFSIIKRFGNATVDFKISNLLDDDREYFFEAHDAADQIYSALSPGRTFSLGFNYQF